MCRFDQLGQAQRPPSIPRPSAADLSSGRVPEPSQPTQTLPPEAQPSPQQPEQQQDGQQQHQQQGEQLEDGPGSEQQRQQQQQQQQHQQHPMQQGFMTPQQYQMMQFQQMRMMQQMMAMQQQQGMHHGARGPMGPWKGQRQQQQQQPRPFQGINQVCVSPVSACLPELEQLCARLLRATACSGGHAGQGQAGASCKSRPVESLPAAACALCVAVSSLNSCTYCVGAHQPALCQTAATTACACSSQGMRF